jgi:hypothetical protein
MKLKRHERVAHPAFEEEEGVEHADDDSLELLEESAQLICHLCGFEASSVKVLPWWASLMKKKNFNEFNL